MNDFEFISIFKCGKRIGNFYWERKKLKEKNKNKQILEKEMIEN